MSSMPFAARESLRAVEALAAPPDDVPFFALARVDDLVTQVAAVRDTSSRAFLEPARQPHVARFVWSVGASDATLTSMAPPARTRHLRHRRRLLRDPTSAPEREPFARHEQQPQQRHRHERDRVQHDGGRRPRRSVWRREERRSPRTDKRRETRRRRRASAPPRPPPGSSSRGTNRYKERNVECPRGQPDSGRDRHPHRKRQRERRHQSRRDRACTASPCANVSTKRREDTRKPGRQQALDAQGRAPEPLGMAGKREQHDQAGHRRRRRHAAAEFDDAQTAPGSPEMTPGPTVNTKAANSSSTVTRSSSRSRMIVANADVAFRCSRRARR